ncbi:MAG: hypothetical protein DMF78_09970 [Acidobacteria bacterium]|nr:MAG: hypothetical protein DMF78_09970 [Acidobacteriota bacterium]
MPEDFSDEEALRRLREFLREVHRILRQIDDSPWRAIAGRHRQGMHAAWESLQPKFEFARAGLTPPPHNGILPVLRLRGLVGQELEFKLRVFADARDRYFDHGGPRKGRSRGRRWWRRWRRRLAPTLAAADAILGGLGSIFPGVEAIREYATSVGLLIAIRGRDRE